LPADPDVTRPSVLVVEDEEPLAEMLATVLGAEGYAVTRAGSALGTLSLARELRPGVIVLDLGLPYRSGASLLADLKADPETAAIPVVVLSGLLEVLDAPRRALAAAVLAKPIPLGALFDAVRAAVRSGRGPGADVPI
jgi:DNA-binding response OmpR family regulator